MSTQTKIEWMRINNDVNGNPRYVCHFFALLKQDEKNQEWHTSFKYEKALKRAKEIGGKKFHNKQYGGGIAFQSYNIQATENQINELLNK